MNFNFYNILEIGVPVVALILFLWIDNVVDFLKNHWKKARCYIGFLLFDMELYKVWSGAGTVSGGMRAIHGDGSTVVAFQNEVLLWKSFCNGNIY